MRILSFALISLLSLSGCQPESVVDLDADIAALTKAKLELWPGYYKVQDADGLADFLHPYFIFITNDGSRSTYDQEVDWVRNNPWAGDANDDFVYRIEDIQFVNDNTAIIYGEGTSTRQTEDGRPCAHSYWSSNTLKRVEGRWRPSFSHVSGAKCEPLDQNASALLGTWDIALYFDPNNPPSSTTMEILAVNDDGTLKGSFYQSPFELARYSKENDALIISFVTSDGRGLYGTSGRLSKTGEFKGQTLSTGRNFLIPWTATRQD